jgi:hypothetical protein
MTREDGHAEAQLVKCAKGMVDNTLSPFIGHKNQTFTEELAFTKFSHARIFVSTLLEKSAVASLPDNFVVTLPKITVSGASLPRSRICSNLSRKSKTGIPAGSIEA